VNDALLTIEDLHTHFFTPAGVIKALDGIDLFIRRARPWAWWASPGAARPSFP